MRPTIVIQEKNISQILSATVNTELQIISPAIQSYNRPPSLLTGSRWQEKCFFLWVLMRNEILNQPGQC